MTPTPFAPIAEKLGTMIRLLSSDQMGERAAAALMITKLLATQKLDIHALAEVVEAAREKQYTEEHLIELRERCIQIGIEKGRALEQAAHPPRSNGGFHSTDVEPSKWLEMAQECSSHRKKRGEKEEQFVEDMIERAENGRDLTEAQQKWLRDIWGRKPI